MTTGVPHVAFVLEQTLGHITHARNLQGLVPDNPAITASFCPIAFETSPLMGRAPMWGNWTVRAGLRSRIAVRRLGRSQPIDGLFVHSQVPAVLLPDLLRRLPSVVSLDATPVQYDELGEFYAHPTGRAWAERTKRRLNRTCYETTSHVVTWSEWAKASLVDHYEVSADRVTVIPPGVNLSAWERPADRPAERGPVRILFVGGDLSRKGGADLLEAFAIVSSKYGDVELHLVTSADVEPAPRVRVHHGLTANSRELVELYHSSHIFCLPTLGDCLPMVLSEAGASSLPLVSTAVGAIPEIVIDDLTGLLVAPGDPASLAATLERLIVDESLRSRLGAAARDHVRANYDARRNADAVVDLLVEVIGRTRRRR